MNFKSLVILLFAQILLFGCVKDKENVEPKTEPEANRRVVAYLPYYRLGSLNTEKIKLVTDVVIFSIFPDPATGDFKINQTNPDGTVIFENKLGNAGLQESDIDHIVSFCKANGVKSHICVGGGDFAQPFTQLVDNGKARAFAQKVKALCVSKGLDGVDIDWEFPQAADVPKVGVLLRALYDVLNPEGLSLSGAFASSLKWKKPSIEAAVNNAHMLDMINVMGYNYTMDNMVDALNIYVKEYGVPREKVIPGVPFYTYGEGAAKGKSYFWLLNEANNNGVEITPKKNQVHINGVTYKYNGVDFLKQKVNFGMYNLGGVMIWELGHDIAPAEDLSLLKAINTAVEASR